MCCCCAARPAVDFSRRVLLHAFAANFNRYKRLTTQFEGVLTGKDPKWGGSLLRPEATGYGVVYFLQQMLADSNNDTLAGKRVAVSGSGNVAQYCAQKLTELGAIVVSLSDSNGYVYERDGFTQEKIAQVRAR